MARTLMTLMALVALLSLSACNSITGPDTGSTSGSSTARPIGGKDRTPHQLDSPDVVNPDQGENSGSDRHPLNRIRVPRQQRRDRERDVVAPDESGGGGSGSGSGESGSGSTEEQAPMRRGKDVVTPGN